MLKCHPFDLKIGSFCGFWFCIWTYKVYIYNLSKLWKATLCCCNNLVPRHNILQRRFSNTIIVTFNWPRAGKEMVVINKVVRQSCFMEEPTVWSFTLFLGELGIKPAFRSWAQLLSGYVFFLHLPMLSCIHQSATEMTWHDHYNVPDNISM